MSRDPSPQDARESLEAVMSDAAAIEWYDDLGPIDAGGWGAVRKMRRIRDGVLLKTCP